MLSVVLTLLVALALHFVIQLVCQQTLGPRNEQACLILFLHSPYA